MKSGLVALGALVWAAPALAQTADPLAPIQVNPANPASTQPAPAPTVTATPAPAPVPVSTVQVPRDWRGVFDAIDAGNWASAQAGIAVLPRGVLTPVAKAELYTAKGSPQVALASIQALLAEAPELPQADQLARLAIARGATQAPLIVPERPVVNLGSPPGRYRARPIQGEPAADQLRALIDPLVKADDAQGAEAQLLTFAPQLSYEARAEAATRIAFIYYVLGLDMDARRVADTWRPGALGDWAPQAAWVSGLASWRLGDCNSASRSFQQVARTAQQRELRAGGLYWAARAEQACRRPQAVEPLLAPRPLHRPKASTACSPAKRSEWTRDFRPTPIVQRDPAIDNLPNVRRAIELAKIGEAGAGRGNASPPGQIGAPSEHHALIQLAKRLDLPAAQLWLANNGQPGALTDAADRYPNPRWSPLNGWRVDPALAFGHIVQEFAVPPDRGQHRRCGRPDAGAAGTAQPMSRSSRRCHTRRGSLTDPTMNLEYGQSFIEMMRGSSAHRRPAAAGDRLLQRRAAAGRALGGDQRQRRSPAVDRIHPLLGNPLLRPRGAAEHVGLSGPQPRGDRDLEGDGTAPLAVLPDRHDPAVALTR